MAFNSVARNGSCICKPGSERNIIQVLRLISGRAIFFVGFVSAWLLPLTVMLIVHICNVIARHFFPSDSAQLSVLISRAFFRLRTAVCLVAQAAASLKPLLEVAMQSGQ